MHEKHIQDDLFHSYVLINTICRENKYLTSVKEEICRKCSVWFGSGCFHVISILSTDTVFYTKCIALTFLIYFQSNNSSYGVTLVTCNKYFFLKQYYCRCSFTKCKISSYFPLTLREPETRNCIILFYQIFMCLIFHFLGGLPVFPLKQNMNGCLPLCVSLKWTSNLSRMYPT